MTLGTVVRGLLGVAAVATLLVPTDLLPDLVPLVGWLDDLIAAGYLIAEFVALLRRRRHQPPME